MRSSEALKRRPQTQVLSESHGTVYHFRLPVSEVGSKCLLTFLLEADFGASQKVLSISAV